MQSPYSISQIWNMLLQDSCDRSPSFFKTNVGIFLLHEIKSILIIIRLFQNIHLKCHSTYLEEGRQKWGRKNWKLVAHHEFPNHKNHLNLQETLLILEPPKGSNSAIWVASAILGVAFCALNGSFWIFKKALLSTTIPLMWRFSSLLPLYYIKDSLNFNSLLRGLFATL